MNDVVVPGQTRSGDEGLRVLTHVLYGLHTLSWFSAGMFSVVAMVINYVKRDDAAGSWQESHFRWRIRTVLWAGGLYLVTAPLWVLLLVPGWIAWSLISIWFLYRVVRGWMNLNNHRAMPT